MHTHAATAVTPGVILSIDRLSICYTPQDPSHAKAAFGLLLGLNEELSVMISKGTRYNVVAKALLPLDENATTFHTVFFEADPHSPKQPTYRLDFNPAKLTPYALDKLMMLIDSVIFDTPTEFFQLGTATRLDIAADLSGHSLEDVIVRSTRKKKHGVYTPPRCLAWVSERSEGGLILLAEHRLT